MNVVVLFIYQIFAYHHYPNYKISFLFTIIAIEQLESSISSTLVDIEDN